MSPLFGEHSIGQVGPLIKGGVALQIADKQVHIWVQNSLHASLPSGKTMKRNRELRRSAFLVATTSLALLVGCIDNNRTVTFEWYVEAEDPTPADIAEWSALDRSLFASVGSIDVRYPKSSIPLIEQTNEWHGSAWRGEKVSAQLVLWSSEPVNGIQS